MNFHYTSDDDRYYLACAASDAAAPNTIKMFRVEGGVSTEIDAGKTQTFTIGNQYRLGVIFAAGTFRSFVETAAGVTLKHSTTGQTFNLTELTCKVTGFTSGANWELWPRTLSGTDETDVL